MIDVQHVWRFFGGFKALEDVTFTVRNGEIVGYVGLNDAGKTTTIRIAVGVLPPSRGDVLIDGYSVLRDKRRASMLVGWVPDFLKPKLDVPLVAINLYEFSPMLDTIINKVRKLWESDFTVEIKGSIEWMMEKPEKIGGLEKFITLHDKKSPVDIYKDLVLIDKIGKEENKSKKDGATKIVIREIERTKKRTEVDSMSEGANLSGKNGNRPNRTVAVVGLRAWKGCVKLFQIRSKTHQTRPKKNAHEGVEIRIAEKARRVVSVVVVGRKDVVSTFNILISVYLRTAGMENVLCLDQDEISSSSSENDESRETRSQHSGH